jgi:hypothetical protein
MMNYQLNLFTEIINNAKHINLIKTMIIEINHLEHNRNKSTKIF